MHVLSYKAMWGIEGSNQQKLDGDPDTISVLTKMGSSVAIVGNAMISLCKKKHMKSTIVVISPFRYLHFQDALLYAQNVISPRAGGSLEHLAHTPNSQYGINNAADTAKTHGTNFSKLTKKLGPHVNII